jgi:CBS domain-containing protein
MTGGVRSVDPEMPLPELERAFLREGVSGFPVVEGRRLVGVVSRSDVVRQLCVEGSLSEQLAGAWVDLSGFSPQGEAAEEVGRRVGERIGVLRVRDVMVRDVVTVEPDAPVARAAAAMVAHGVHRLPVVDGTRLLGIVSSLDLVRLLADAGGEG